MTDTNNFDAEQDDIILARYRLMEWNDSRSENAVIACPRCGNKRLRLDNCETDDSGVSLTMWCDPCNRLLHLGIQQQKLFSGQPYIKLITD